MVEQLLHQLEVIGLTLPSEVLAQAHHQEVVPVHVFDEANSSYGWLRELTLSQGDRDTWLNLISYVVLLLWESSI